MASTCIVTGGAGFIGCAISAGLARQFDRVIAVDSLHPQIHLQPVRPGGLHRSVSLVIADITLAETWDRLLQQTRPDVIVHLAAETGTAQSLTKASRHATVNVVGTTRMLDALARTGLIPKRIILASSRAVYGEGAWRDDRTGRGLYPGPRSPSQLRLGQWQLPGLTFLPCTASSTEPRPTSIYGVTKLAQEQTVLAWASCFEAEVAILRLQNVYGPGQSLTNPYTGIVPLFARVARASRSIPVYEDGQMLRDFVFIEDVAAAICRVASKHPASGIYDIGSGRAVSVLQLATQIADYYGAPAPHTSGAFRGGDVRHATCDIARARNELDWQPHWNLTEGLSALCLWVDACAPPSACLDSA